MKWVFLCALCVTAFAERVRFDGYKVLDITPRSQGQVEHVHQLSYDDEVDFWTEAAIVGITSRIMIPPHKLSTVASFLEQKQVDYVLTDDNVQEKFDEELLRMEARFSQKQPGVNAYDPEDFNTFEDIESELVEMVNRCPVSIQCELVSLGESVEGREIWELKIKADSGTPKRAVWIDSNIHAREWLASATVLRMMDYMTTMYGTDDAVTNMIDVYDWYFVPIMNPDGYVYSWDTNRSWRKSRNSNELVGSTCMGTDLNRNYDVNWGLVGISTDPCSDIYMGDIPASEPETQVIQNEIDRLADDLDSFVTFHCAANIWAIPWGHSYPNGTCVYADDHDEMMAILDPTVDAIENTHGDLTWARGTSCETIYQPASGTTCDYAKYVAPTISLSAIPELRGSFAMPPETITPSFEENWNGIVKMVEVIQERKKT